jgi:hypothetical protein
MQSAEAAKRLLHRPLCAISALKSTPAEILRRTSELNLCTDVQEALTLCSSAIIRLDPLRTWGMGARRRAQIFLEPNAPSTMMTASSVCRASWHVHDDLAVDVTQRACVVAFVRLIGAVCDQFDGRDYWLVACSCGAISIVATCTSVQLL